MKLKAGAPKPRKTRQPNRYHKRVLALAQSEPVMLTHREHFSDLYTCGDVELNPSVVLGCIRHGWLKPANDGLFPGSSQTFVATTNT